MENLTIAEANQGLKDGKFTSVELTQAYLEKAKADDLNSYISVTEEMALEQAKTADSKGDFTTPLTGIPMNLKDLVCVKGTQTTAGSKILKGFKPAYTADFAERLLNTGAVLLGKTNTDEFAMGGSNETSAYGPVKNPWDKERVPGGSSGGPAASVAADQAVYAIGSDTGGSIRQPASFCSTVGLKVTYGRVPRHGVTAYASSFDTIGPITKTVEDAAMVLNTIAGKSDKDSTTPDVDVPDYTKALNKDIKGIKVGVPKEFFAEGVEEETKKIVEAGIETLKALGAEVKEVSLPLTKYAIPAYYILVKSEASTNMARYDGVKYGHTTDDAKELLEIYMKSRGEGFGDEVKRAIMLGTYTLSAGYFDAYYLKAAKVRNLIKQEYEKMFEEVDVLATPVSPFPAFKIGEKIDDPVAMYSADILTTPINLAGVPALSVPAGFTEAGLPVGMQLIAKQFAEETLLHVGYAFEQATDFHTKRPS